MVKRKKKKPAKRIKKRVVRRAKKQKKAKKIKKTGRKPRPKKVFVKIKKNKALAQEKTPHLKPEEEVHQTKIRIIGIGGGAGTIVSEISSDVKKVDFVVANTDNKSLRELSKKVKKFQFGQVLTKGLGTGMNDILGETAALNEKEKIKELCQGYDFCVVVACLGGGTSSGATPVFAKILKSLGILTYGIFTLPFKFEGEKKMEIANRSLEKIKESLNTFSVIPNERIFEIIDKNTPLKNALSVLNKKLAENLEGLIEMIYLPGLINIDFADLKTILRGRGRLTYLDSVEINDLSKEESLQKVVVSHLYPYTIKGARGILYNINGGRNLQLSDVSRISKVISNCVSKEAKIIFGVSQNKKNEGRVRVDILATGCGSKNLFPKEIQKKKKKQPVRRKKSAFLKKRTVAVKAVKKAAKPKRKAPKKRKTAPAGAQAQPNQEFPERKAQLAKEPQKVEIKIRRNGLQLKEAIEEEEKEILKQEKVWETPAILRKKEEG